MKLSKKQLDNLSELINTELLKRGFNVKVKEIESNDGKVIFSAGCFQTTPVLFKSIQVLSFSSSIIKSETKQDVTIYDVYISVGARFEIFGGGTNGVNLFSVFFRVNDCSDSIHKFKTV